MQSLKKEGARRCEEVWGVGADCLHPQVWEHIMFTVEQNFLLDLTRW